MEYFYLRVFLNLYLSDLLPFVITNVIVLNKILALLSSQQRKALNVKECIVILKYSYQRASNFTWTFSHQKFESHRLGILFLSVGLLQKKRRKLWIFVRTVPYWAMMTGG